MFNIADVSILNIMPPNVAKDAGVKMAAAAFDEVLREIILKIPNVSILPRIREITDNLLLDLLAWQFHVDFYRPEFSVAVKQELIIKSLDWHSRKGTPSAVGEVVTAALGESRVVEWYNYGGTPYTFKIQTEMALPDLAALLELTDAITSVKNTRSWLEFIEQFTKIAVSWYFGAGVYCDDTVIIRPAPIPVKGTAQYYAGAYPVLTGGVTVKTPPPVNITATARIYAGAYAVAAGIIRIFAAGAAPAD